jgi:hypothetical protein
MWTASPSTVTLGSARGGAAGGLGTIIRTGARSGAAEGEGMGSSSGGSSSSTSGIGSSITGSALPANTGAAVITGSSGRGAARISSLSTAAYGSTKGRAGGGPCPIHTAF